MPCIHLIICRLFASMAPYALKGQKLLAQGNTLGIDNIEMVITPCKGKSFHTAAIFLKLLPLQGAELQQLLPRALPWARSFCPFRACREIVA